MAEGIQRSWELGPLRYVPRLFVGGKMSHLDSKGRRLVGMDIASIKRGVRDATEERPVQWDPFYADEVVPATGEEDGSAVHEDEDILETNSSAICHSDGAILHAYDDGSSMLGHFELELLGSSAPKPVLVVAHRLERLSKAWTGLRCRHPLLTFERFDDDVDLYPITTRWIAKHAAVLESGPAMRRARDERFASVASHFEERFAAEESAVREEVALSLGFSARALTQLFAEPWSLARVGADGFLFLLQRYPYEQETVSVYERARSVLHPSELRAWRHWSSRRGRTYAERVLDHEVRERTSAGVGIFRERDFLGQLGAWDDVERRWQSV